MKIIGIVGGVASGKSTITVLLEELGAVTIDVDKLAHHLLRQEEVHRHAKARWGKEVFLQNGEIDRRRVGQIVFSDDSGKELKYWETFLFPRIEAALEQELDVLRTQGTTVVVVDAAVLLKAKWDHLCDTIVYVHATEEQRLARARRRGWSDENFHAREFSQTSVDMKRTRADYIIDNSGTLNETKAETKQFWQRLGENDAA